MNRLFLQSLAALVTLLGAAGSLGQTANVTLYGRLDTSFNDGKPYVDTTRTDRTYISRNASRIGIRGSESLGGGLSAIFQIEAAGNEKPALASVPGNFRQTDPMENPYYAIFGDIVSRQPAAFGGLQFAGSDLVVASNVRRTDGNFDVWLDRFEVGTTFTTSIALKESLKLTKPLTLSEESFDVRVANSVRYDSPAIAGFTGSSVLVATARKVNEDCHEPVLHAIELDSKGFVEALELAFTEDFMECHLRYIRTHGASPWSQRVEDYDAVHLGVRCRDAPVPGQPTPAEKGCLYALDVFTPIKLKATKAALNTTFGGDGQVIIKAADGVTPLRYWDHAVDSQGKVLVSYGLGRSDGSFLPAVLRLNANGTLDTSFAVGGVLVIPTTGASTNPRTITSDIYDSFQVTGETFTANSVRPFAYFHTRTSAPGAPETYDSQIVEYTFAGHENSAFFTHVRNPDGKIIAAGTSFGNYPDVASMQPLIVHLEGPKAAIPAIEYFHAGFGHYATIANPIEIDKLDTGVFAGWNRTGYWFNVYPVGTPGTLGIDRFFSDAFDPKSSHFYAANAMESAIVKQNPDWTFEGTVFGALVPSANGRCSPFARPVSRVYNNGKTGAPNHRFGDAASVVAEALAAGGVLEGTVYCTE